jgi:hypothetical protein
MQSGDSHEHHARLQIAEGRRRVKEEEAARKRRAAEVRLSIFAGERVASAAKAKRVAGKTRTSRSIGA